MMAELEKKKKRAERIKKEQEDGRSRSPVEKKEKDEDDGTGTTPEKTEDDGAAKKKLNRKQRRWRVFKKNILAMKLAMKKSPGVGKGPGKESQGGDWWRKGDKGGRGKGKKKGGRQTNTRKGKWGQSWPAYRQGKYGECSS